MGERVGEEEGEVTSSERQKCMEGRRVEMEGGGHIYTYKMEYHYVQSCSRERSTGLLPI